MPSEILSFGPTETDEIDPEDQMLVIRSVMDPICQRVLREFPLTEDEKIDFMYLSEWSLGLHCEERTRHLFEKILYICKLNLSELTYDPSDSDIEKYGPLMVEFGWGLVGQKEALIPTFDELHRDKNLARRDYFCTLRLKNFLEAGLAKYG